MYLSAARLESTLPRRMLRPRCVGAAGGGLRALEGALMMERVVTFLDRKDVH